MNEARYIRLRLLLSLVDRRLSRYRLSKIQTYINLYSCALIIIYSYYTHAPYTC
jgi:hypothetical protein